jgi:hypothetical protein
MPSAGGSKRRKRSGKRTSSSVSSGSKRPRVVKGRVNLRVVGYSGLQKIPPSALIPFLPASKLRQAAKRALGASGKGKKKTHRRRKKRGGRKKKGGRK